MQELPLDLVPLDNRVILTQMTKLCRLLACWKTLLLTLERVGYFQDISNTHS